MIGVVGILFGWVLGYLLCYGWSKITIFNPLTGTTVPLQIYYSLMHYVAAGGISLLCCAGAAYFRRARRRGFIQSRSFGGVMTEVALQAVELVRRIEGTITHTLVNGVDLAVNKGEFVAITGPSGSGKSSLLYPFGLLDAPSEGEVIICGQPTSKLSESDRADVRLTKCGFVFQFHFLLPEFTSLDNVLLPMRAAGIMSEPDMRERGLALLGSLGLEEHAHKRPNQLSVFGQRQRVAIARALSNRPEIIIADEPTGALDTKSTEQVFSILRDIADQGQTVVVVTHDPALAARADRRIHIVDGKIAEITAQGGDEAVCEAAS